MEPDKIDLTTIIAEQQKVIQKLERQSEYLVEAMDKLAERFNSMGRLMMQHNKELSEKLETKITDRTYIIKPHRSEQIGELVVALSKAKTKIGVITRGGKSNRAAYAKLEDLLDAITPVMEEFGLDVSFFIHYNEFEIDVITLSVTHSSGQYFETTALLHPEKAKVDVFHQAIGSAATYMKRYMLKALLGLAEE